MARQPSLTDTIRDLAARQSDEALFAPEVVEAMRLADLYEDIQPKEYILPLNALGGFSTHPQQVADQNQGLFIPDLI